MAKVDLDPGQRGGGEPSATIVPFDSDPVVTAGMTWEGQWGQKPPPEVARARANLVKRAEKVAAGGSAPITLDETRWLNEMTVEDF